VIGRVVESAQGEGADGAPTDVRLSQLAALTAAAFTGAATGAAKRTAPRQRTSVLICIAPASIRLPVETTQNFVTSATRMARGEPGEKFVLLSALT